MSNGGNNLDSDPKFVNPIVATSAPTTTGDYRLGTGSPAINTGNSAVTTTSSADGSIRLDVTDDDSIVDASSRPLGGSGLVNGDFATGEDYTIDWTAPVLTLTPAGITAANAAAYPVSGTCTTGDGDVTVSVGSVSGSTICTAGNFTTSLDVSGLSDGASISVSASQTDTAGNLGSISTTTSKDTIAPTVVLSTSVSDPTNASTIPVTVTFSKAVTGFTATDVLTGNATLSNFSGSGSLYTFVLTPSAPSGGGRVQRPMGRIVAPRAAAAT